MYDNDNDMYDTDYNYASAESMYKRIARLTDYHEIAVTVENATDKAKYEVHIRESGTQMTITISPVIKTRPNL